MKEVQFSTLSGYTLENIYSRREVIFTTTCGKAFVLQSTIAHHWQEGDDASVLDSPVVTAEYSVIKKKYQTEDTPPLQLQQILTAVYSFGCAEPQNFTRWQKKIMTNYALKQKFYPTHHQR